MLIAVNNHEYSALSSPAFPVRKPEQPSKKAARDAVAWQQPKTSAALRNSEAGNEADSCFIDAHSIHSLVTFAKGTFQLLLTMAKSANRFSFSGSLAAIEVTRCDGERYPRHQRRVSHFPEVSAACRGDPEGSDNAFQDTRTGLRNSLRDVAVTRRDRQRFPRHQDGTAELSSGCCGDPEGSTTLSKTPGRECGTLSGMLPADNFRPTQRVRCSLRRKVFGDLALSLHLSLSYTLRL